MSLLALLLYRRCRNTRRARQAKIDTRTARPFVPPTASNTSLTPLHFASDIKDTTDDSAKTSPQDVQSSAMATRYPPPPPPQQPGEGGFLPADINRIVSMVVARIDTSHPPEHGQNQLLTPDSDTNSYDRALSPPPAQSSRSVASIGMQPNVNIDSILTALGARVDPTYREQATFRSSTDLPPLYRLPPGYQG